MKAWEVSTDGRQIYNTDFTNDATLELTGDFESATHRMEYANLLADKLNRRMKPLTEEAIKSCERHMKVFGATPFEQLVYFARAIEQWHGIGGKE